MNEMLCSIDWERLIRIFAALLTPVIAIVTAYIAFQQYQTNRRQHRLALFEKRMVVFDSTLNLLATIVRAGNVELEQLFALLKETRDSELLFGPEIEAFIHEVYRKGVDLNANVAVGNPAMRVELLTWFFEQSAEARKKFLKYLDFRQP